MFNLLLIPHSDISTDNLEEVIKLKSISWPYSRDEQIKWISSHLKDSNLHALLKEDDLYVAYLNLIPIDLKINGKDIKGLGIGNVCTSIRGKGWGREIMLQTNAYLQKNEKTGLLFCRDRLIDFYCMCGWHKIENSNLRVAFDYTGIVSMYYNYSEPLRLMEFSGNIF